MWIFHIHLKYCVLLVRKKKPTFIATKYDTEEMLMWVLAVSMISWSRAKSTEGTQYPMSDRQRINEILMCCATLEIPPTSVLMRCTSESLSMRTPGFSILCQYRADCWAWELILQAASYRPWDSVPNLSSADLLSIALGQLSLPGAWLPLRPADCIEQKSKELFSLLCAD